MIEYEQQDLDRAKEAISKGFLMDIDRRVLTLNEKDIISAAKNYYRVRLNTYDPVTGTHL